jgi:hypothetical protein
MCGYMDQRYLLFLNIVSQKMIPHFYVHGFGMEHWVFCNAYGTGPVSMKWTWVYSSPKSLMVYEIQKSWEQQLAAATYSTWVVDWATLDYLQEDQDTTEDPKNWQVPEVDFLSNRHPAKSASEKPWSAKEEDAEYQRPKSGVWRYNLKIRFTTCRCEVPGDAWKQAHRHIEKWMSGLVAVK